MSLFLLFLSLGKQRAHLRTLLHLQAAVTAHKLVKQLPAASACRVSICTSVLVSTLLHLQAVVAAHSAER